MLNLRFAGSWMLGAGSQKFDEKINDLKICKKPKFLFKQMFARKRF